MTLDLLKFWFPEVFSVPRPNHVKTSQVYRTLYEDGSHSRIQNQYLEGIRPNHSLYTTLKDKNDTVNNTLFALHNSFRIFNINLQW